MLPLPLAALSSLLLLLLGLLFAARRTREVHAQEQLLIARDLAALSAHAASFPRHAPLTALVTGANSGIGYALALALARCGVRVILGCRSAERGAAALSRIRREVGAAADVVLLQVDVADPASVVAAAARCRGERGLAAGGLHLLFLNAGMMPLAGYRWGVALHALLRGALGFFLTTGRATPEGAHFLAQPLDAVGAGGAPSVFATNVLGHLLLAEELMPLLASARGGVVWTGSRAATAARCEWGHLAPPPLPAPGEAAAPGGAAARRLSGHEAWLASRRRTQGEAYGESKWAMDLLSPALSRRLAPGVRSAVVCPGFVDTEFTPPFFKAALPAARALRGVTEAFHIAPELGAHTCIAAALALSGGAELRPDRKYVLRIGRLVAAGAGAPRTTEELQERMWDLCQQWLRVWREIARAQGEGGSREQARAGRA